MIATMASRDTFSWIILHAQLVIEGKVGLAAVCHVQ